MVHNIFKGLGIALVTPFNEDGSVDYKSLIRLVEYQLANGADFLCILATTGETPTLTDEEKQTIKETIVSLVNGRIPILMGCGGNNTASIVHELQTRDFKGIDGMSSQVAEDLPLPSVRVATPALVSSAVHQTASSSPACHRPCQKVSFSSKASLDGEKASPISTKLFLYTSGPGPGSGPGFFSQERVRSIVASK